MQLWSKTILSVYRYLERITNAIDNIVSARAINSFYTSGKNLAFNDVRNVSDDILNLTERKIKLINLKLITEKALEQTDKKFSKILILSFIEKRNCYECAELLGISLRTYFRRMNTALKSFEKTLVRSGYDLKFFDEMLGEESWITSVRKKLEEKSEKEFKMDKKFEKVIHMDLKKTTQKQTTCLKTRSNFSF